MTPQNLKASPRKTLESIARKRGVAGCTEMRKDELIRAILKTVSPVRGARKRTAASSAVSRKSSAKTPSVQVSAARRTAAPRKPESAKKVAASGSSASGDQRGVANRNLSQGELEGAQDQDLLAAIVLGPHWLRAHWTLSPQGVRRAELALGAEWHRAAPVLRLLDVTQKDGASNIEVEMEQIVIHGGVRDWYVPLDGLPRSYRLQIGYTVPGGKFYSLARSNIVTPPLPGHPDAAQGHWMDIVENCEQVFAMSGGYSEQFPQVQLKELFEQRLQRSMDHGPVYADVTTGSLGRVEGGVKLNLKTEVIIYGVTSPNAQVVFEGKPVKLDALNSFRLRMPLNEGRHVVPIVATNAQTSEQQTAVLAVERNLKNLDLRTSEDL